MSTRLRTLLALSAFAALGLLAPTYAKAGAAASATSWVTIDDAGLTFGASENIFASLSDGGFLTPTSTATVSGTFPGLSLIVIQESPTNLGMIDMAFDYHDNTANPLAPTAPALTLNYNISGPGEPLSDTLSVVFRGLAGDLNTHVEVHFKSDNDLLTLTQLTNGIPITETGAYQDLSADIASRTPLLGFHLRFASDVQPVPLPSAVWSGTALLSALGATTIIRRRRRLAAT